MSLFTCITCRVAFADTDVQRAHYKTDWHRYNLKRKVAELPPVTAESFQQKVLVQRAQVAEQGKDTSGYCSLCSKHFATENALQNHNQSKKHKEIEAKQARRAQAEVQKRNEKNKVKGLHVLDENEKMSHKQPANEALKERLSATGSRMTGGADIEVEEEVEEELVSDEEWDDEEEEMALEECLFCSKIHSSLEKNIEHMSVKHGFFIPEAEYVVDLEGLVTYLGEKVAMGHVCLWCNEKGRSFHTKKSVQQHMVDKGHCMLTSDGDAMLEYADFYDYRSSYPDYQEGGDGDQQNDEEQSEGIQPELLLEEGYQLVLPSGSVIGHRSLMKYYKQNLPPVRSQNRSLVAKVTAHYKALAWTGMTGQASVQRARDIQYVQKLRQRHHLKLGMKANMQKHYRDQNPI